MQAVINMSKENILKIGGAYNIDTVFYLISHLLLNETHDVQEKDKVNTVLPKPMTI